MTSLHRDELDGDVSLGDDIRVEVRTIPSVFADPFLGYYIAVEANDYDIAGGMPVSGFMLDALEGIDKQIRDAVDRAVLYGIPEEGSPCP